MHLSLWRARLDNEASAASKEHSVLWLHLSPRMQKVDNDNRTFSFPFVCLRSEKRRRRHCVRHDDWRYAASAAEAIGAYHSCTTEHQVVTVTMMRYVLFVIPMSLC